VKLSVTQFSSRFESRSARYGVRFAREKSTPPPSRLSFVVRLDWSYHRTSVVLHLRIVPLFAVQMRAPGWFPRPHTVVRWVVRDSIPGTKPRADVKTVS